LQSPDPGPPLSQAEAHDPRTDPTGHYSKWCGRGAIVLVHQAESRVKVVPLRCGSWACPDCGPAKAAALKARLRNAKATAFLTLTCAQPAGCKPGQAERSIRKGWSKFVAKIREFAPDFEYFKVWEYQKNGWPHLHVLVRAHYIPKHVYAKAWHLTCWPGFVKVKAVRDNQNIPHELCKYMSKCYKIAKQLDKGMRIWSASQGFFLDPPPKPKVEADPSLIWFITNLPPAQVYHTLMMLPFMKDVTEPGADGYEFQPYSNAQHYWVSLLLIELDSLPWFSAKNSNLGRASPPDAAPN